MHHDSVPPIVHRDISSKNIMLDSELEAHVSDFGTAKFLKSDSYNWSSFAGTFGYAAPELAYTMEVNEKNDIYSYGVLSLEVVMGRHPGDLISSISSLLWSSSSSAPSNIRGLQLNGILGQRIPCPTDQVAEEVVQVIKVDIQTQSIGLA